MLYKTVCFSLFQRLAINLEPSCYSGVKFQVPYDACCPSVSILLQAEHAVFVNCCFRSVKYIAIHRKRQMKVKLSEVPI